MEFPPPNPVAKHMARELAAALDRVVLEGHSIEPAFVIARQMTERRLVDSTPGVLIAMALFELTVKHLASGERAPDPYAAVGKALVATGHLRQADLQIAVYGNILNTGLQQGWLDASLYDQLVAFGGQEPQFLALLPRIERRSDRHVT